MDKSKNMHPLVPPLLPDNGPHALDPPHVSHNGFESHAAFVFRPQFDGFVGMMTLELPEGAV